MRGRGRSQLRFETPVCPAMPLAHQQRPLKVPCARHAGHQVVAQAVGELREAVGGQRRNAQHVGPAPQLDVHDGVADLAPGVPLVLVARHRPHALRQRLRADKVGGGLGADDLDLAAQVQQQLAQLRHLNRRDAACGVCVCVCTCVQQQSGSVH
jgi:hypothetical protein